MAATDPNDNQEQREGLIPRIRVTRQERNRLVLVGLAFLVLYWLLSKSFDALGPFILALVLAYLMLPLVERLARLVPRVLAILLVYVVFILIVVLLVDWLAPLLGTQIGQLSNNAPDYYKRILAWGSSLTDWYNSLPLSAEARQSIQDSVKNSLGAVGSGVQGAITGTVGVVSRTMGFIVGLLIIPFWLFYLLKDKDRGIQAFNGMLPLSWREDVWRMLRVSNGILSSYIRGQLLLALAVGVATTIGMLIVGAPYPFVLGAISGFTEVIPVIGPLLGAVPGLILALVSGGDWVLVLKVLAVYVIVQQLENNLLVPKIQGDSVNLHPAIIMVALVVGSQVAGLFGLIMAVPVTAIMRDLYLYLYRRFTDDYTPTRAEESLPSRQDEQSTAARAREERELREAHDIPGITTEDELIDELDRAKKDPAGKT